MLKLNKKGRKKMPTKLREDRSRNLVIFACFLSFVATYIDNKLNLFFWYYGNESLTENDFTYKIFDIPFWQFIIASFFWAGFLSIVFLLIYYVLIKINKVQ